MSPVEAAALLEISLDSTPDQIEARFLELRAKLEEKIGKAPTPGLKDKYRRSLEEVTTAFEALTLAADSSTLPVLKRASASTPVADAKSPPPLPGKTLKPSDPGVHDSIAAAPSSTPAKKKKHSSKEFIVVALVAIALLGGGGWFVLKTRSDAEEKVRQAALAKEEAEALLIRLRSQYAESKVRWESVEKDLPESQRRLSELKGDLRNTKELDDYAKKDLQTAYAAQDSWVGWLGPFIQKSTVKTELAKLESFLAGKAAEEAKEAGATLARLLTNAEKEFSENRAMLLATTGTVQVKTATPGAKLRIRDAYGRVMDLETPWQGTLPPGDTYIVVSRTGWADHSVSTSLIAGKTLEVNCLATVTLKMTSEPTGSTFTVKNAYGAYVSGKTPWSGEFPVGDADMVVSRPGWADLLASKKLVNKVHEINASFPSVNLKVTSEPIGSTFTVKNSNGASVSGKTPWSGEFPVGYAESVISRPGWPEYRSSEKFVNKVHEIKTDFPSVSLKVVSEPAGSTFTVKNSNGASVSGNTPWSGEFPVGKADAVVSRKGWPDIEFSRVFISGNADEIMARFPSTKINVTTDPIGCNFLLKNEYGMLVTGKTPWSGEFPLGLADITVFQQGWADFHTKKTLTAGETTNVSAEFVYGSAEITSTPAGAEVFLGERRLGTTPCAIPEIFPGPVALNIQLKGHRPGRVDGFITARQKLPLSTTLEAYPKPEMGKAWQVPESDLKMVWITPGTFKMGSRSDEEGHMMNEERASTTLTKGFWMGSTEVTQEQYRSVIGKNPSYFKGDKFPVERVSWNDAKEFCRKLTTRDIELGRLPSGYRYALPTEAQWEYACRAGNAEPYAGNGNLFSMGWYAKNSGEESHQVGLKDPNAWGLYDMHGNVSEWCEDWYANELLGGSNPIGPVSGSCRVNRGGSWLYSAGRCRSAYRDNCTPANRDNVLGFRLILISEQQSQAIPTNQ